jgi:enediyne biosynthesis protein E4
MKKNSPSTATPGLMLSLAALILPPVSDLKADIFTRVTAAPWTDIGTSRGGAWGDYDNDGFIDLFVPQSGASGGSALQFLYHNNANGTFTRVTNGPIAAVVSTGWGAAWGDYDNDGFPDLFLGNINQQNYLFHNNGAGSFTEDPNPSFVSDIANSRSVTWVDYDNDGYVDLFRTTLNEPRRLYYNNHDGTFPPVTGPEFLTAPGTFLGVAWGDYNNDGRPDLFLPQGSEGDPQPSRLYRNDGGGSFTNVATGVLAASRSSHGAAWGDYDNDGDLDLFVANGLQPAPEGRPNFLYRNNGDGTFTSLTSLPANDPENQGGASLGCNWGDYDNDGWLDLFVVNRAGQNNFLYHNNGDGTFTKITNSIAANDGGNSAAAAWGDYDNDGFLDLFVGNVGEANFLYHNNTNDNHWLKFRLIGTRSNRAAIGAKVRVHATINGQSIWQMREVPGGDGQMGQNSLYLHVGLGNATTADLVRIEWPSGTVQELQNVPANEFHTVTEPGGEPLLASTGENGERQLTLTGKQGCRYEIWTSTDLITWNSDLMVTVTNADGTVIFPAPGETSDPRRFYRAGLR